MNILPAFPTPTDDWLRNINERFRKQEMPPAERPFRALEELAAQHGQPAQLGALLIPHLGGPAWQAIDSYFRLHTKLGLERVQPLSRSAWYYDGSFYQVDLFVVLGGTGPSTEINPFSCLAKNMPNSLLHEFSQDEPQVQAYLEHLSNALDSLTCSGGVRRDLKEAFAGQFLGAAEALLDSAVTDLLDTAPNVQSAGHCRFAFESSLKGLLAEKGGLTEKKAKEISHHLDRLLVEFTSQCGHLISPADLARLQHVADDSTLQSAGRKFFPDVASRYEAAQLSGRRLWDCYASAQHSFATILRALGGSDSR
jgi:hypothetical protein